MERPAPIPLHADVSVHDLAHPDLLGRMLRKSFGRRPPRRLYWHPRRALLLGWLTGGAWPALVLLWRLSRYANHHRFRGRMLLDWIEGLQAGKLTAANSQAPPNRAVRRAIDRVRPQFLMAAAGMLYLASAVTFAWLLIDAGALPVALPGDSARWLVATCLAMLLGAALHGSAIWTLHRRFARFIASLAQHGLIVPRRAFRAPTVYPVALVLALALLVVGVPLFYLCWPAAAATWLLVGPLLAAELQRGYITRADCPLRYAIARQIGARLYTANSPAECKTDCP